MTATREQVMEALFTLVGASASWQTKMRNWQPITAIAEAERPALLMLEEDEQIDRAKAAMPAARQIWQVQFLIYAWTSGNPVPASVLNPLLDAIFSVLSPGPVASTGIRAQTLGGLVYDCWIAGRIIRVNGYRDGQALAIIPARILVPGNV